ncbi:HPP family protein [Cellvibrio japonicus]|uniref:HPP family n=1 Tax=Cellvibrio japonicus (strain Ueda107) TaxID=498211 RepID=B3PHM0_CELJU|nr:HPP family protein [Cellvibrio japonicus]ACE83252.1 HPP family [Cellvibrio japonicus Ueda107]QEI12493.1 HPP domain-containing protein [Cellvibrio japonicus]QEI16067.1 HPP domain-containing protein [Cellvibrio japonicus]QEI19645.1 HPP domain-containing protein [Cellvibrio japonicus]
MSVNHWLHEARALLGIERNTTSHHEKLVSALGAFLGILAVYWGTRWYFPHGFMHTAGTLIMVTSMGASAVLLFAVPQGALSQPWQVLGGHLISAFVGVSCQQMFPDQTWTPALAVGLAVGAMHYARCIHPPGGATALAAVIGGPEIYRLEYYYLLMPILVNVTSILLMAVAFNALFPWRRYPAHLTRRTLAKPTKTSERQYELTQEDFSAAMEELDSYIDITHDNLTQLLELAKQHAEKNITHPNEIIAGRYYSNGKLGNLWSVRQVIDAADSSPSANKDQVIYKTVAGDGAYATGICLRTEFRLWARYEVKPQANGHWLKCIDE